MAPSRSRTRTTSKTMPRRAMAMVWGVLHERRRAAGLRSGPPLGQPLALVVRRDVAVEARAERRRGGQRRVVVARDAEVAVDGAAAELDEERAVGLAVAQAQQDLGLGQLDTGQ